MSQPDQLGTWSRDDLYLKARGERAREIFLESDALRWTGSAAGRLAFDDIVAVNFDLATGGRNGTLAECCIQLRYGENVKISMAGQADKTRERYATFIRYFRGLLSRRFAFLDGLSSRGLLREAADIHG